MLINKKRPKSKIYKKVGCLLKTTKTPFLKKKTTQFYLPSLVYLATNSVINLNKQFKLYLTMLRKFKLYFGFYKTSSFKKILKKDFMQNTKIRHFLKEIELSSILERRIDIILYNLGFVNSLFEAKHLISHKKIAINNKICSAYSHLVKKGDVISFENNTESNIKKQFLNQKNKKRLSFNTYSNVEVNYKLLKIIILTKKINILEQLQHYSNLLDWKILIKK